MTKITPSHFAKTIMHYQKVNWTSSKQYAKDLISNRTHPTNVHEVNKHPIKAILNANRPFIPIENQNKQIALTFPWISASSCHTIITFANETDQTHKSLS